MTISDNNTSLDDNELCSWVGHVHYTDGHVKEISVLTADRRDKLEALAKVCKFAGIKSPNEVNVKGVILQREGVSGERTAYGAALRATAQPSNVVELRPTMNKFRVTVYPTPHAGYSIVRDITAPNSVNALEGVLKGVGIDDMAKAGPYLVQKYGEQDSLSTVLKHGIVAGTTVAPASTLPVPYTATATAVVDAFKLLLSSERTHRVPRNNLIKMESNYDEPAV